MCYYVTQKANPREIAQYYQAQITDFPEENISPYFMANGFAHPVLSVVVETDGGMMVDRMQWGLMNNWKRSFADMLKASNGTLNDCNVLQSGAAYPSTPRRHFSDWNTIAKSIDHRVRHAILIPTPSNCPVRSRPLLAGVCIFFDGRFCKVTT